MTARSIPAHMNIDPCHVSVVICTRDRADRLARLLESIGKMLIPDGCLWEIVLVDNGSTDNTAKVIEAASSILPIRTFFEGRAGLSNARNTGAKNAKGKYIIWTDDDVLVSKTWLASYTLAFEMYPDALIFGGEIIPILELPANEWFHKNLEFLPDLLAKRSFPDGAIIEASRPRDFPYGANFAVRSFEQRQVQYDTTLGVGAKIALLGEETDVLLKILRNFSGYGVWVGNASVNHLIPTDRQTVNYIKKYYFSLGRTTVRRDLETSRAKPPLMLNALVKSSLSFAQEAFYKLIRYKEAKYISRKAFHLGRLHHLIRS